MDEIRHALSSKAVVCPALHRAALTPKEALEHYPELAKSEGVLGNLRNQKRGPKYYKIGRKVVYRPEDIEAFLFQNPVLTIDSIERGKQ